MAEAGIPWLRLGSPPRGPFVYRRQVEQAPRGLEAGTQVELRDRSGRCLGYGLYHPRSEVAVRILHREDRPLAEEDLRRRAHAALERRRLLGLLELPMLRLLHAEADDLPALVVDRYGPALVAQLHSRAALPLWRAVAPVLRGLPGVETARAFLEASAARAEREPPWEEEDPGFPARMVLEEHGLRYEVPLRGGHKTGFFCDQRDNRRRLRALASGRRVLDLCCCSGGFALNAAAAGAREVLGVDLDQEAVAQARRNANLNQTVLAVRPRFVQADAFSYLRTLQANGRRFDLVILDPPKLIRSRREMEAGIAGYHDLNKLALALVEDGGLLLSCSCSGLLRPQDFRQVLRRAARTAGRSARLLGWTGAGPDHPVRLDVPESEYLKAAWLQLGDPAPQGSGSSM